MWLDEENPSGTYDLHAFTPIFTEGITQAVRAAHGAITIPDRWGRAYGAYTNDVSPWVLGWIIGREVYAFEVYETNQAHTNDTSFVGTHLSLPVGSPAECWVTARLDDLARYEQEEFGTSRPISFSSWPTLDPLYHPSENSHTGEDSEAVDLANLDTSRFAPVPLTGSPGPVQGVSWAATHRFFELQIATDPAQRPLVIGFDTHRTNWAGVECGETVLPNGTATPVRSELALVLDGQDQAQLYVTRAYDLFGIWHDRWGYPNDPNQLYCSTPTTGDPWHPLRWLSNLERVSDRGP